MENHDQAIAVIGMAGRFPGARTPEELWSNLRQGVESIRLLSDAEMEELGVPLAVRSDPSWIPAAAQPEGIEDFDAPFFGINHREAEILDPQHRWFLEVCWEALENAGYVPEVYKGLIGVCGGMTTSTYLFFNLARSSQIAATVDPTQLIVGNGVDTLTTRVSYKLNLKGPSHSVQSACSTSLVAVHTACQMLLHNESDMVLAGGVSINVAQRGGYKYVEDGQLSPDGHVRVFDAQARGTVFGSGAGVVVLKRLEDALADGDTIRAVILGSAVNNDGSLKVGFAAPGVDGQAEVISEALGAAGVEAESISYIEAHGTGTALGDPIEIQALNKVYRDVLRDDADRRRAACQIGSVKTNIGHLDVASGVSGLIKTVLAMENGQIPASLHFKEANPRIDFAAGPVRVASRLTEWKRDGKPRRAAVSSFGFGGTNAHMILEEAPEVPRLTTGPASRPWRLLTLSARSTAGVTEAAERLAGHLRRHPETDLGDAAYTLLAGRRTFPFRRAVICRDVCLDSSDAVACLEGRMPERMLADASAEEPRDRAIAFLFPAEGVQHVGMARELYATEPVFRELLDRSADLLLPHLGLDLRSVLYPSPASPTDQAEAARLLSGPRIGQPALFAVEHALARLWMSWGVMPQAMLGQGIGELVAACLSGVFPLEDALAVAAERGRVLEAPSADAELLERVRRMRLFAPRIPFLSSFTGAWMRAEGATDPMTWARQLRAPARIQEGLATLLAEPDRVLLEVGPGHSLTALAAAQAPGRPAIASLGVSPETAAEDGADGLHLMTALGRLWLAGHRIDAGRIFAGQGRRRVPLPSYPFERLRYWIEPDRALSAPSPAAAGKALAAIAQAAEQAAEPGSRFRAAAPAQVLHPRPRLATPFVPPDRDMEKQVAAIWRRVLGVAEVGIYDSFLDLGGDSLLATQMLTLLREELRADLPLEEMFADPTVAGVAAAVEEIRASSVATSSPDRLAALLAEIQGMSESELEAELAGREEPGLG
jgi:acyl transferase domain-containing protein